MATTQDNGNTLTKAERKILIRGLDTIMSSNSRSNAREQNEAIIQAREKENQEIVILKNKLTTQALNL